MSLMMNRALVIIVLAGYVFCEEKKDVLETKPPFQTPAPPDGNSTSSVVIEHKVQNFSVDYKNDHSHKSNASYVIKSHTSSNSTAREKPLIISTSKEVRLIQNIPKLNDSRTLPTTKSNVTQRHSNSIAYKNNINNHKKDATTHFRPTNKPFKPSTTSVRPVSSRPFDNSKTNKKFPAMPPGRDYAYSYFNMADPKNISNPNNKNASGIDVEQMNVEQMEVKEMRLVEDRKENMKFEFFIVSDEDSLDSNEKPKVIDIPSNKEKSSDRNTGNHNKQKPLLNYEKNGHSKPYQEGSVPKKYGGYSSSPSVPQKPTTPQQSTTPSITTTVAKSVTPSKVITPLKFTTELKSTTPSQSTMPTKSMTSPKPTSSVPVYTVRPWRHYKLNLSTTNPTPSLSHNKFNASIINPLKNEVANDPDPDFDKGEKRHKYPTYPSKEERKGGAQAVKLQGPDGDSILGDSKTHYAVARPAESHAHSNHSRFRFPKSGLKYHREPHGHVVPSERRKPYMGLETAGSYSSHVGGTVEYTRRPEVSKPLNDRFRDGEPKKLDTSDLYNLDELDTSGSLVSGSHVKYETKEIHIPYPEIVEKRVPYPIHIKVDRPVPVHIDKPYPVHVEKKVPVPVKVHVPQPYPVEKEVPYPVKIPIEVPRPVEVAKPVPYVVEKPVPVQIIKEVKFPVKVPVDVPVPYKVPVHVEKRVPYFVDKKVPFEVPVAVEKPYFIEIKKPFEVPIEKPHPVTVEKKIPVPVQMIEFIRVPIPIKIPMEGFSEYLHRSGESHNNQQREDPSIGVVPVPNPQNTQISENQSEESKFQHRIGTYESNFNERGDLQHEYPFHLPRLISIDFSHPDLYQSPIVTSLSDESSNPGSETETKPPEKVN